VTLYVEENQANISTFRKLWPRLEKILKNSIRIHTRLEEEQF